MVIAGQQGLGKRKREETGTEGAKVASPVAAWLSQARTPAPGLQPYPGLSLQHQPGDLLRPMLTSRKAKKSSCAQVKFEVA